MNGAKWAAALGFLLAAAHPVWAGWEIEQTNYNLRGSGKEIGRSSSTMRVSKDRMRLNDGMTISIYDYGKDYIALLVPAKKLYWGGTVDEYIQAVRNADPKRRVLPGELHNIRKPEIVVSETPITAQIAGKSTKKYAIHVDGLPYQEIWITDKFLGKDLDTERYIAVQRKLAQSVRSSYGVNLDLLADDPLYKKITTEGYPVKVHTYLGEAIIGTEVVRIANIDVPDSDFTIPDGFNRVPLVTLIDEMQKLVDASVAKQRQEMDKALPEVKAVKPTPGKSHGKKK